MSTLSYSQYSSTTASFGPYYSSRSTAYGYCSCNGLSITNAQISGNTAYGSSPGGAPFSAASLLGFANSYTVVGSYVYNGITCSITYNVVSGSPVLGVPVVYSSFYYWWAVLVGVIVFCFFGIAVMSFCGLCAACCAVGGRDSRGRTLGGPTAAPPVFIPPPQQTSTYTYTTQPGQFSQQYPSDNNIPIATAIPVNEADAPVAYATPTTEQQRRDERQITTV